MKGDFDLDLLPAGAASRLHALRRHRDDLHALLKTATNARQKAREERDRAQGELERLQKADDRGELITETPIPARGPNSLPGVRRMRDVRQLTEAENAVQKAKDAIAKLDVLNDERSTAWEEVARLAQRLEDELDGGSGFKAYAGAATKYLKADPITARATWNREIRKLHAELAATAAAPRPSGEMRAVVHAAVDRLAEAGKPDLYRVLEGGNDIGFRREFHQFQVQTNNGGVGSAGGSLTDPVKLIAWAFRDLLLTKLDEEIAEASDDTNALSIADRRAREAKLTAKLLEAARCECHFVWQIFEAQGRVDFRQDTDIRAVLDLSDDFRIAE